MTVLSRIRVGLSFLIGGSLIGALRLFGRRGTALPGRVIERLHSTFLQDVVGDRPVILITGTNGKTSTANALRSMYRSDGKSVIGNEAGSNMVRGIIGSLLAAGSKKTRADVVYIFEVEEATLPKVIARVTPTLVIVTNLFRDQLDAYGELAHTAALIHDGLRQLPATSVVLLTADDPTVLSLQIGLHATVRTIGLAPHHGRPITAFQDAADALFCPTCSSPLEYDLVFYNHLGVFRCTKGHCRRPETPDSVVARTGHVIRVQMGERILEAEMKSLPLYMLYNVGTAATAGLLGGLSSSSIISALHALEPAFGRGETIETSHLHGTISLIKNPAGANAIIATLLDQPVDGLWILLNDDTADGRDVSWIWDADWELLASSVGPIWLGGRRSWDLALRLKYAGVEERRLRVVASLQDTWAEITRWSAEHPDEYRSLAILPTYTALLDVHRYLEGKHLVKGWR